MPNILLVEDSRSATELVSEILKSTGLLVQIKAVASLKECLESIGERRWDVVLLDLSLPDATGVEAARAVRALDPDLAVIILTATDDAGTAVEALKIGCQDFLIKGRLGPDLLVRSIQYAIDKSRLQKASKTWETHQTAIVELSQLALSGVEFPKLIDSFISVIQDLFGVKYCRILRLLPGDAELAYEAGAGWDRSIGTRHRVPSSFTQAGFTLRSSEPVIVDDFETETRFKIDPMLEEHGIVSGMSVTAKGRFGPFGVLSVHSDQLRKFSAVESRSLQMLGDILGAAAATKRMQTQLLLADKLAALGTLAAGIAHEINNPLGYVLMNQEQLLERLAAGGTDEAIELAKEALGGVERTRAIVRGLKTFSRHDEAETRVPCDLHAVLEDAIRLGWNEIRYKARFDRRFESCPRVSADPARLSQVFLNLLINAAQAIAADAAEENEIRVTTGTDSRGNAVIGVSDTGHGIQPENVAMIFDPFFTTKAVGSGTGLGLSVCHNIVSALNGELSVESVVGKGTTFTVKLPALVDTAIAPSRPAQAKPVPTAPPSSILVVDDEVPLLEAIKRTLLRHHQVAGVSNGKDALELLGTGSPSRFDLILCDISMPGLSGIQLFEKIREISPPLSRRFAFITGGALSAEARMFLEKGSVPVLDKPFSPKALEGLVNGMLNTATSEGSA